MKEKNESQKVLGRDPLREERVIGILRPKKQPEISEVDGLLKLKNEQLFSPDLRNFEAFLTSMLNRYAEESHKDCGLVVAASFYLDPHKLKGFPLFGALVLEGAEVDSVTVRQFREVTARITSELTEQPSLFHQTDQASLAPDNDEWLDGCIQDFRRRNSGKNYATGFSVHLGSEDTAGMLVSGRLPLAENPETIRENLEGIAFVDGFKHTIWTVFLVCEGESGQSCEISFTTSHRQTLKVASEAFSHGKFVRYKGYRIQKVTDKTSSYHLKSLEQLDSEVNEEHRFELTE